MVASSQALLQHVNAGPPVAVVGVDEAQFFDDGLPDVCNALADRGIRVIVAGLDLDYEGRPFGPMPRLLALAEEVTKLHAVCVETGRAAHFSHRIAGATTKLNSGPRTGTSPWPVMPTWPPGRAQPHDRTGWTPQAWRLLAADHPGSSCHFHGPDASFILELTADTRRMQAPDSAVFFALRGPWHDGHDHIEAAHSKGVRRFVVNRLPPDHAAWSADSDVVVVADVLDFMQGMAWRNASNSTGQWWR